MDLGAVSTVIGIVAGVGGGISIAGSRRKNELIELQEKQAAALRAEMADNERRCEAKITARDSAIADLRGQVSVLREQQAEAIGRVVAPIVADEILTALRGQR